jgi:hypothetical protein
MVEPGIRNPLMSEHDVTLCKTDETNSEDSRQKNNHRIYYEGYSEINFLWAVKKKQERRKNILLYTKISYIRRLLLDIITL